MSASLLAWIAAASPLWGPLVPGPHGVGFDVSIVRDESRRLDGGPRPLQIVVWYPAAPVPGSEPVSFGAYARLADEERPDAKPGERPPSAPDAGAERERLMRARMAGVQNAPVTRGRFPLIVIAQGNGQSAQHQAVLAEYLASHGYVVATSPAPLRLGARMESEADVLPVAQEQARDLRFVAEEVARRPSVGGTAPALVGHSFGARAALLAAAALPPSALVSLDGGIGSSAAKDWLSGDKTFDPAAFRVPLLHFYEEVDDFMTPDLALLRSLDHADRILVRVEGLAHRYFTSLGWASAVFPAQGDPDPRRAERCAAVAETTRLFLDARVKARAEAAQALAHRPDDDLLRFTRLPARAEGEPAHPHP